MDFRILGPLEVYDAGRPLARGAGKQRALLAILLLHPNEVVSADRLIDELWGGRPPGTAAKALQVHVSQLRKALTPTAGDRGHRLHTRAPGYLLEVGPEELDAQRFERLTPEAAPPPAGGGARAAARRRRRACGPRLPAGADAVARTAAGRRRLRAVRPGRDGAS